MDVIRKVRELGGGEKESLPPLEPLAIDIEEWLNLREIEQDGGYRKDQYGQMWWLPAEELAFYESINNDPDYEDDEAFGDWFDSFINDRRLKKWRTSAWSYGTGVKKTYDSESYFKRMWTGFGFGGGYGKTETTELATALSFVQTLIQAVRTKPGRYEVEFASGDEWERPVSYSDFENQHIVVSPQAALDKKIDADRRMRVTTGWALHEAAHTEHTVDRWPVLFKPFVLKPPQVAKLLMNIIEDVRIERLMGKDFPGFADYFEDSRQYLWEIGKDPERDATMGEMPGTLDEALRFIVRAIRWPDKLEPVLSGDEAREEFEWWKTWNEEYATTKKIREHMEKAMNRLSAMFRPEMEKLTAEYEEGEKGLKGLEKALKKLIEELSKKLADEVKSESVCSSESPDKISTEDAEEVRRKLREEWEIEKKEDHDPGVRVGNYDLLVKKPEYDPAISRGLSIAGDPLAQRLKAAFVLRPARPEYADRLLRSGQVDDDELWRWGVNDFRVFEQKIRDSAPDTDITLLVDESGSMYGEGRMGTARRLAGLMHACLSSMSGVNLKVRGHTGQNSEFPSGIVINRIWEPGDDPGRMNLLAADAQNMDGYAIEWCVRELLEGRGNTQKILIVLADGEPYAHGYGGDTAKKHVREVVTKAERNGVYVIQLGVGHSLMESDQRSMFNHYIPYIDDENLLRDLTKLMTKLF